MAEHGVVLSALVDGQVVDPVELRAALEEPDAVGLLVDFAALRARLAADDAQPQSGSDADWPAHARSVRRRARLARIVAAAAVLMLAVSGGFWLGHTAQTSTATMLMPSDPLMVRQDVPAPAGPCVETGGPAAPSRAAAAPVMTPGASEVPPAPSRVFHLSNDLPRISPDGGEED